MSEFGKLEKLTTKYEKL